MFNWQPPQVWHYKRITLYT